jgi:hypothetical protein
VHWRSFWLATYATTMQSFASDCHTLLTMQNQSVAIRDEQSD